MKNIHIENSYTVWNYDKMLDIIFDKVLEEYDSCDPSIILNRGFIGMCIEWYLHNIGYYLTLPFIKFRRIHKLNIRFKHLDLNEHRFRRNRKL